MKQEIILTIGLPGCGKSTWADEFIQKNPNYMNVNRDDLRLMIQGRARYNKFSKQRETIVSKIARESAIAALDEGKSVIVSDTNLNGFYREQWYEMANDYKDVTVTQKLFTDVPMGLCIVRDSKREFPVGSKVIMRMFTQYQDLYWPKPVHDPDLPNCIICDIDGTISSMNGRSPFQWDKVGEDLPKQDVIDIVNGMTSGGRLCNNTLIIMSGRDGVCREETTKWLNKHNVRFDEFYIRNTGDSRKDYIIKEELYNNHIKGQYNVKGVFDDRDQVIFLWRHLGLTCLQVDYGSF